MAAYSSAQDWGPDYSKAVLAYSFLEFSFHHNKKNSIVGASLSELYTSGTALHTSLFATDH